MNRNILRAVAITICIFGLPARAQALGERPPATADAPQKVAEGFSEEERKTIFQAVVEAEKHGKAAADRQYPNDLYHNVMLTQQLSTKYRRDVLGRYGLTEDSEPWRLIAEEGVRKNWIKKD